MVHPQISTCLNIPQGKMFFFLHPDCSSEWRALCPYTRWLLLELELVPSDSTGLCASKRYWVMSSEFTCAMDSITNSSFSLNSLWRPHSKDRAINGRSTVWQAAWTSSGKLSYLLSAADKPTGKLSGSPPPASKAAHSSSCAAGSMWIAALAAWASQNRSQKRSAKPWNAKFLLENVWYYRFKDGNSSSHIQARNNPRRVVSKMFGAQGNSKARILLIVPNPFDHVDLQKWCVLDTCSTASFHLQPIKVTFISIQKAWLQIP